MVREVFKFGRRGARGGGEVAILSDRQHELIAEELGLLQRLSTALDEFPATEEDRDSIDEAADHLTALFMLVIVGEFNSGKSAFINALAGADVMPEGVTPTTAVINLLRYGEQQTETMSPDGVIIRTFPADFLEEITVVDTPGTNAIIREHEALTQRFVPRADIIFFVTSSDRPFTESERAFMEAIREWGKKIVLIVNKIDIAREEADVTKIVSFVKENISRLLGFTPEVFPISALLAQQAKALGDRNPNERKRLWTASRFGDLETYIFNTLDEEGRIRLKLLSPLGISEHVADRYLKAAADRLHVLDGDLETIANIERQLNLYQEDMKQQFRYHLTRIENIIAKMTARGDEFFEETIRLGRIFDLLNTDKIRAQFEKAVVGDTDQRIDETINELIDWMVEQDLRTWQAVNEYIDRRRLSKYEAELIGEVGGQFRYDRKALLDSVSKRAQEEVDRYDVEKEAHQLSLSVRNAVAQVAVAEAGAVGLGALVVAAASTAAIDITGILAASVVAGIGLFILPRKRRQSRNEFRRRAEELESRLSEVMSDQFNHELARSVTRINDAVAPYTRFVRTEQEKLTRLDGELTDIRNDLRSLRHRIGGDDAITAPPSPAALAAGNNSSPIDNAQQATIATNDQPPKPAEAPDGSAPSTRQ